MISCRFRFIFLFSGAMMLSCIIEGQNWNFAKEKEGIKIYTCTEAGKDLKSYMGIADINAPAEKVFALIEDVNNTDWWDKNFSQIKILLYEKYKRARYYLVYNLPWPVTDRDLCVDVSVVYDSVSGGGRITATPLDGIIPEYPNLIRIKEYRQTWTVKPAGRNLTHVVLEGYIDPAGSIPEWITNMLITESPIKVITEIKQRMEKSTK
jgi:hypothetical protein